MATNPPVNPENPTPAYIVPPDTDAAKFQASLATLTRDIGIMVGFSTAVIGFAHDRNLSGLSAYLHSNEALPALGIILAVGISTWRWVNARRNVKVTALAATSRPNSVVQVKES